MKTYIVLWAQQNTIDLRPEDLSTKGLEKFNGKWCKKAAYQISVFYLTNVRNLKVLLEVHGRDIAFAKSEQSYHLISTDTEAAAVRLLLPLHRKRQSHTILYACMWNGIKPIFIQVFDPMTLTCCFCFWRMLRIQLIAESICLTLALVTHTKKIKSFDGKRGGSHEMLISDVCHNYKI